MSKKVAVFISGQGTNLQALINASQNGFLPIEILLVVTNNSQAGGVNIAQQFNIPVFCLSEENKTREEYDNILVENCRKHNIDFVVLAGWMRVLSKTFIDSYESTTNNF